MNDAFQKNLFEMKQCEKTGHCKYLTFFESEFFLSAIFINTNLFSFYYS